MQAFYDLDDFPKLKRLAGQWRTIRSEFLTLQAPILNIDRVGKTHAEVWDELTNHLMAGGEYGWLLGWDSDDEPNPGWMQYGLCAFGTSIPQARRQMPKTFDLLDQIEGIKVCALSKMKPNLFLALHHHPEIQAERLLQFHITVDVPIQQNYAYLNVNGEFRRNGLGDSIVFDGSLEHFALNASRADRTILYMEFSKDKLRR